MESSHRRLPTTHQPIKPMSNCQGTQSSSGTGQAQNGFIAMKKALTQFFVNGQQECAKRECEAEACTFGLTGQQFGALEWTGPTPMGNQVQVSVSGDGTCFCS